MALGRTQNLYIRRKTWHQRRLASRNAQQQLIRQECQAIIDRGILDQAFQLSPSRCPHQDIVQRARDQKKNRTRIKKQKDRDQKTNIRIKNPKYWKIAKLQGLGLAGSRPRIQQKNNIGKLQKPRRSGLAGFTAGGYRLKETVHSWPLGLQLL